MIKSFHGEIIEIGRIAFEEIANQIDKTDRITKNAKIAKDARITKIVKMLT